MFRWHVISGIMMRNLKQYFTGALGYVFIIAFVTISALMTFNSQFFADNLANLDQLTRWFPLLLLFFAPAVAMSVWAEERRSGTDAILFTLPATDLEILLGKYLSLAAVYTISLLFSFTQLIALNSLGSPDWGVIAATYFGYWLAGLALLSIGMFASSLTESTTVAFVLGALLCAIPVLVGSYFQGTVDLASWFGRSSGDLGAAAPDGIVADAATKAYSFRPEVLSLQWNLHDFTTGLIPLANVLYFVSVIVFMLYLNLVVISRRHWSRGQQVSLAGQYAVRIASLAVALLALNYTVNGVSSSALTRLDLTGEKLFSLDKATLAVLDYAKENKKQVTIQAFVSEDVPRRFVNTRKQLLGLLKQLDFHGGNYVDVQITDVRPNSEEALAAQRLGIEPQSDRSEVAGRIVEQQVYLGTHLFSDLGDATLPVINEDTAIEYELTRSIAGATDKKRQLTLGILDTDTRFGGPEFDGQRVPWAYNKTLKQLQAQFKVEQIRADELANYLPSTKPAEPSAAAGEAATPVEVPPARTAPSVLLVADPASLDDAAADALVKYLQAGHPTILLVDPLPFYWTSKDPQRIGVLNAPRMPRVSQMSPFQEVLASSPAPKADGGAATRVMQALGLEWDNGAAVWSVANPHPGFAGFWPSYLGDKWPDYYGKFNYAFVFARANPEERNIDPLDLVSRDLKELLFFYPGSVNKAAQAEHVEVTSLVRFNGQTGVIPWKELTFTPKLKAEVPDPRTRRMRVEEQEVRSQITGDNLVVLRTSPRTGVDLEARTLVARVQGKGESKLNALVIADLDFVSDLFYEQQEALGLPLDNLKLLQNSLEVLAGEEGFAALRGRRPTLRTLTAVERQVNAFRGERATRQKEMEDAVQKQLDEAQASLDEKLKSINQQKELNVIERLQLASQEAADVQSEFDRKQDKLDKQLQRQLDQLKLAEQKKISALESRIQWLAVALAPLPAVLLGVVVFFNRRLAENRNIRPERKV